jgi:hypothetical protein
VPDKADTTPIMDSENAQSDDVTIPVAHSKTKRIREPIEESKPTIHKPEEPA